jgi:hypothetical protein
MEPQRTSLHSSTLLLPLQLAMGRVGSRPRSRPPQRDSELGRRRSRKIRLQTAVATSLTGSQPTLNSEDVQ